MSLDGAFWAFLGISTLVIVTPGPDTAITIRNTLLGGRRGGIWTSVGVAVGQAIWALGTSLGVVTLLVVSEMAFSILKLIGAAYLIFLGVQALLGARRREPASPAQSFAPLAQSLTEIRALRQGLISDLSNPKMAAFFSSLLPQFAPTGDNAFVALFSLGLVFSALTFVWLTGYSFAIALAGDFLRRPRVHSAIEALTGTVLIALGIRIATEAR